MAPPPLSSLPRKPKFSVRISIIRIAKVQPAGAIKWYLPTSPKLWQLMPDKHGCLLQAQQQRAVGSSCTSSLSDKSTVRVGKQKQALQLGCDEKLDIVWPAPHFCPRSLSISYKWSFIPHWRLPWKRSLLCRQPAHGHRLPGPLFTMLTYTHDSSQHWWAQPCKKLHGHPTPHLPSPLCHSPDLSGVMHTLALLPASLLHVSICCYLGTWLLFPSQVKPICVIAILLSSPKCTEVG